MLPETFDRKDKKKKANGGRRSIMWVTSNITVDGGSDRGGWVNFEQISTGEIIKSTVLGA